MGQRDYDQFWNAGGRGRLKYYKRSLKYYKRKGRRGGESRGKEGIEFHGKRGLRELSMLRTPLLLAPKAGKVGKEGELKEKGAERLFVDDENSTNQQGITGTGSSNMGDCDQEVENNRGITETEPEPEREIATGLEDMLLDDEEEQPKPDDQEEQPKLDDQDLHSTSQLESCILDQEDGNVEIIFESTQDRWTWVNR